MHTEQCMYSQPSEQHVEPLLLSSLPLRNSRKGQHLTYVWLQVHQGYSDLVRGLLEKLTQDQSTSVSITASDFTLKSPQAEPHSGRTLPHALHLKSHADLRYAVALLLLAAEALPEQDVEFTVCRLLFDQARQPSAHIPYSLYVSI